MHWPELRHKPAAQQVGLVSIMSEKLWMTEEIQRDVSQQYAMARMEIEPALNAVVDPTNYGALKKWYFIAIVPDDDDPNYPEVKKYHKKRQEFEFRLKIDHATFKSADDLGKRKLIMTALLRSIDEMRKLVPKGIDDVRLESDVCGVAAANGWL